MTLIDDIARMEATAKSSCSEVRKAVAKACDLQEEYDALLMKMAEEDKHKIVLDPSLDPDPYGNYNMSLTYRLKCMGWP